MVFGEDLLENAHLLAGVVDHVEIVLFYTPSLHNFPSVGEIKALKRLGADEDVSFSVHLPAFLEIASLDREKREKSVQLAADLINFLDELNPMHHILHIPYSAPTLTPVPGLYFTSVHRDNFIDWTRRAIESLEAIQVMVGQPNKILIENTNYSPIFLECFWKLGLCQFCLDLGHLLLGRESVVDVIQQFIAVTQEVHLHGVQGWQEHLSLAVMPESRVSDWLSPLVESSYSEEDLKSSIHMLIQALQLIAERGR